MGAGQQAVDIGHDSVMFGVRVVRRDITLWRRDTMSARGRQGADDRLMPGGGRLSQTRLNEGGHEIARAVFRNAQGLLDLERAQWPKAGE